MISYYSSLFGGHNSFLRIPFFLIPLCPWGTFLYLLTSASSLLGDTFTFYFSDNVSDNIS